MTKIDIHADDYGYSLAVSRDILECMKAGCLDSISIICNTSYFEQSMALLYENIPFLPFLPKISIHLDLPEGLHGQNGLPMSWSKLFIKSYMPGRNRLKEILKSDLRNQIKKTQPVIDKCIEIAKENNVEYGQHGIRLDSHVHTHLIPVVWDAMSEVIAEDHLNIEFIRNPKEPIMPFLNHVSLWKTYSLINIVKNRILMFYSGKADRYAKKESMNRMYMWGLVMSGHMDYDRIQKVYPQMLKKAQDDNRDLEILLHPGKAEKDEFDDSMDKGNFDGFSSSDNRHVEKDAVLRIRNITN